MKLSIKWVLIISVLSIIWGTYITIAGFSYFTSEKVLINVAKRIMKDISYFAIKRSKLFLNKAYVATDLTKQILASNIVSYKNDYDLLRYFFEKLQIYRDFAGIYLARPDGEFVYVTRTDEYIKNGYLAKIIKKNKNKKIMQLIWLDNNGNVIFEKTKQQVKYNPLERPWYKNAIAAKSLIWTDAYLFHTSHKPGITISAPSYRYILNKDQDSFIKTKILNGVVGVDLELVQISNFISKLPIGKNGHAVLINKNGDVVAFHDFKKLIYKNRLGANKDLRLVKIGEIKDEYCKKAFYSIKWKKDKDNNYILNKKVYTSFNYNSKNYLAMLSPFKDKKWPWIFLVYMSEDDFLAQIIKNRNLTLLITVVISFIATIFALFLANSISKPIEKLERESQAIKIHNYNNDFIVNTVYKEIQETSDTFLSMKLNLIEYEKENKKLHEDVKKSYLETIHRLAIVAEYKDKDTAKHLQRVSAYAVCIATHCGLSTDKVELIKYACPMHDVGKMGISDAILTKPGRYNPQERKEMEQHTLIGVKILSPPESNVMRISSEIAYCHHEKWDGTGYPRGLKGEEIPLTARIVAIADVFDALVSKRSYKDAFSFEKSVAIIKEGRGTHFDPKCVDVFITYLDEIKKISKDKFHT